MVLYGPFRVKKHFLLLAFFFFLFLLYKKVIYDTILQFMKLNQFGVIFSICDLINLFANESVNPQHKFFFPFSGKWSYFTINYV